MSPRSRALTLALFAALAACSTEQNLSPSPQTTNTKLAVSGNFPTGMAAAGDFVFVLVNEAEQSQTDLNGDGDVADNVVHRVNTETGQILNLELSGGHNFATDGRWIVWTVREQDEGADLNGDADQSDHVLALFDTELGLTANNPRTIDVTVDPTVRVQADDGFFAFCQIELLSGVDMTGDGDQLDVVLGVLDAEDASVFQTGLGLDPASMTFVLRNRVLAFAVSEAASAATDMNADADASDVALAVHRCGTGGVTTIPHAVDPTGFVVVGTPAAPVVAYAIDESNESGALSYNQNGISADFDLEDMIAACWEVVGAHETLPGNGIAIQPSRLAGSRTRLVLSAPEEENGLLPEDLNGDGDTDDVVPFWIDLDDLGTVNSVGIAQSDDDEILFPHVCDEYMFMAASEADQGVSGTNYNAHLMDSDTDDSVLFFVDLRTPGATSVTNMRVAANQLVCPNTPDPGWVIAIAPESDNGDTDLNQDGDSGDEVVAYFPISPSGAVSTVLRVPEGGATSNSIATECEKTISLFSFAQEGTGTYFQDENVDQDIEDVVATVQLIDKQSHQFGEERFLGTVQQPSSAGGGGEGEEGEEGGGGGGSSKPSLFPFAADEHTLVFPSTEAAVGTGKDYNDDGDTADTVLFHVKVTCD